MASNALQKYPALVPARHAAHESITIIMALIAKRLFIPEFNETNGRFASMRLRTYQSGFKTALAAAPA
jgi:hypothetical protein